MNKKSLSKGHMDLKIVDLAICPTVDPIGLCTILDCMKCENCNYRIIMDNGEVIKDFSDDLESEKYLIEFFDDVKSRDILNYLYDNNSDYRITRECDGVVLRYSHSDLAMMGKTRNSKEDSKGKTFIKKITNMIKGNFY